ncbi:serine hydrolase domain-containing protein [Spongiimicrobium salis]|uniref:serine hydrolase domain-containing protein n=1 Tax=Spongiimicrobium salis TaxID=1667022 RepID=UPI00374D850D
MNIYKRIPVLLCTIGLIWSCTSQKRTSQEQTKAVFGSELQELKAYFQIPGMAILVKQGNQTLYEDYLGVANVASNTPLDSTTTFPMASLTKIFSGIIMMQLLEEDKTSLEEPVNTYVSLGIPDSVKVKHVLSHTSQGKVGKQFYYSNRFGLLTPIIEQLSGQSYERAVQERIIDRLQLKNTYLLKDSTQLVSQNRKIAAPYLLGGEMKNGFLEKTTKEGFIDYGFSASAGITATVQDLALLSAALDQNTLISKASKEKMTSSFVAGSPYGLGIFTQEFLGEQLIWGYGQYDCYSSLFLKVPSKDLTLILAANNNLMSDPARLINGDVTSSLFALSFLKNYVLDRLEIPLFESRETLARIQERMDSSNREFYRKKLMAQLSAENYMVRFDAVHTGNSKALLDQLLTLYPDYESYGDLTFLFNLQFLKAIAAMRGEQEETKYDEVYVKVGEKLLKEGKNNPYANYYMANYYDLKNEKDKAAFFYRSILEAENFSPWWYTQEAKRWLESHE